MTCTAPLACCTAPALPDGQAVHSRSSSSLILDVEEIDVTGLGAKAEMEGAVSGIAGGKAIEGAVCQSGVTGMGAAPGVPQKMRARTGVPFTTNRGAPPAGSTRTVRATAQLPAHARRMATRNGFTQRGSMADGGIDTEHGWRLFIRRVGFSVPKHFPDHGDRSATLAAAIRARDKCLKDAPPPYWGIRPRADRGVFERKRGKRTVVTVHVPRAWQRSTAP